MITYRFKIKDDALRFIQMKRDHDIIRNVSHYRSDLFGRLPHYLCYDLKNQLKYIVYYG